MNMPWTRWTEAISRPERHVVGLMSGTSVDAIDAVLVRFARGEVVPRIVAYREYRWDPGERVDLLAAASGRVPAEGIARLHAMVGERFADAAEDLVVGATIRPDAVGSHGQTIAHVPKCGDIPAATLQIGAAPVIAKRLGCVVVHDFRWGDVAAGGHGAPLVPSVDAALYRSPVEDRILINIGGIANITWLPRGVGGEGVLGFDTGPGNCLIDHWVGKLASGRITMDRDGRLAEAGTVDPLRLGALGRIPGMWAPPPTTFDRGALVSGAEAALAGFGDFGSIEDAAATLTEFTVSTIANAVEQLGETAASAPIWVSGGGARNRWLMRRLGGRLAPRAVRDASGMGIPADAKEAVAFAVLADAALRGERLGMPAVTGARSAALLGSFAFP